MAVALTGVSRVGSEKCVIILAAKIAGRGG